MAIVIGFTGLAGSGKDTLAQLVTNHLVAAGRRPPKTLDFADPIREVAAFLGLGVYNRDAKETEVQIRFEYFELDLCNAIEAVLGDYAGADDLADLFAHFATALRSEGHVDNQTLRISPRRFCQLLGTEGGRRVRDTFWIDVYRARCAAYPASQVIFCPGVRFPNEQGAVQLLVGITRPDAAQVDPHDSERFVQGLVDTADIHIDNVGSLEALGAEAKTLARYIKETYDL